MAGQPFGVDGNGVPLEIAAAMGQTRGQALSGPSTCRQRASRVTKPASAGSSPQDALRGRTSACHSIARHRSELIPQAFQVLQQDTWEMQKQSLPVPRARPMSWHPSTISATDTKPYSHLSTTDLFYRNPVNDHPVLANNGIPTPPTQPEMTENILMDPCFNLDKSARCDQLVRQQPGAASRSRSAKLKIDAVVPNISLVDQNALCKRPAMPFLDACPVFSPPAVQMETQAWTESLSTFPAYTAPLVPDLLPIQKPHDFASQYPELPELPRKDSTELIGMGLYDDFDRRGGFMSSLTGALLTLDSQRQLRGKGLKLEETWEPPEDDDDDESDVGEDAEGEDDGNACQDGTEGACEDREHHERSRIDQSRRSTDGDPTTEIFRQLYGDMSNQSFFFDQSDDNYTGMDVRQSMLAGVQLGRYHDSRSGDGRLLGLMCP
ncbi:MAG: hypothetical protein MMC23_008366 [Stictis urceolatum]|nr:hypothetical protein [Stictis urceolata]